MLRRAGEHTQIRGSSGGPGTVAVARSESVEGLRRALCTSSGQGDYDTVKLLFNSFQKYRVDGVVEGLRDALRSSLKGTNVDIVKLLLDQFLKRIRPEERMNEMRALLRASVETTSEIYQLILAHFQRYAEGSEKAACLGWALHNSAQQGRFASVKRLLRPFLQFSRKREKVEALGHALRASSAQGHADIVLAVLGPFLQHADTSDKVVSLDYALGVSSERGHPPVVQAVLRPFLRHASSSEKATTFFYALWTGFQNGYSDIVQMIIGPFLKHTSDNTKACYVREALDTTRDGSPAEHKAVFRMLLSRALPSLSPEAQQVLLKGRTSISSVVIEESVDCSICFESNPKGGVVKVLLPCVHSYHVECIEEWLSQRRSCPLCRASI